MDEIESEEETVRLPEEEDAGGGAPPLENTPASVAEFPTSTQLTAADAKGRQSLPPVYDDASPTDDTVVSDKTQWIAGRYEVMTYLGEGGMGRVFHVRDHEIRNRELALKLLHKKYSERPQFRELFFTEVKAAQGHPRRMNISSKTMIWTGLILAVFTVIHLINFKYGPGIEEGYTFVLDGETARDLYRLVAESFAREVYVVPYVLCMILLGYHIRHGFWSAFQSLGVNHPRYTPVIYGIGVLAAIVLGVGFLAIPIWFYIGGAA